MTNQTQALNATLDPAALRTLLVTDIGLDEALLATSPDSTLEDLGMDSLARVELGVVLKSRFGVTELPEDASTMTLAELTDRFCG